VPIALSVDIRSDGETAADRGSIELDLGERDANDVWEILKQHAAQIHDKGFKYEPTGYNSNGTVGNLLRLIGLESADYLPDTLGGMFIEYYNHDKIFQFDFAITGGDGDDRLVGREQEFSEKSNQTFFGGTGKDTLLGGAGNDGLFGQENDDLLEGRFGNDRLDGGDGLDSVRGGLGGDIIIANFDEDADSYDGGLGEDTIVYKYSSGNSLISIKKPAAEDGWFSSANRQTGADFGINITRAVSADGTATGDDTLASIEKAAIEAGDGEDMLGFATDGADINVDLIDYIDLGSQSLGGGGFKGDVITFANWTKSVTADLSKNFVQWKSGGIDLNPFLVGVSFETTNTVTVRNAEAVFGGFGDDILLAGSLGKALPGKFTGNDARYSQRLTEARPLSYGDSCNNPQTLRTSALPSISPPP
jgi:hypothetical protein